MHYVRPVVPGLVLDRLVRENNDLALLNHIEQVALGARDSNGDVASGVLAGYCNVNGFMEHVEIGVDYNNMEDYYIDNEDNDIEDLFAIPMNVVQRATIQENVTRKAAKKPSDELESLANSDHEIYGVRKVRIDEFDIMINIENPYFKIVQMKLKRMQQVGREAEARAKAKEL
ncbi:unnamed protein product [Dovyalis caffra]|uniref:Uncharacterized protein n=1 Tax=Dovyalis caffra TaxID=77055 RepID=A0AAV1QMR5_9ROSI|nr:unnamed protein product [Dovyalis caffra]